MSDTDAPIDDATEGGGSSTGEHPHTDGFGEEADPTSSGTSGTSEATSDSPDDGCMCSELEGVQAWECVDATWCVAEACLEGFHLDDGRCVPYSTRYVSDTRFFDIDVDAGPQGLQIAMTDRLGAEGTEIAFLDEDGVWKGHELVTYDLEQTSFSVDGSGDFHLLMRTGASRLVHFHPNASQVPREIGLPFDYVGGDEDLFMGRAVRMWQSRDLLHLQGTTTDRPGEQVFGRFESGQWQFEYMPSPLEDSRYSVRSRKAGSRTCAVVHDEDRGGYEVLLFDPEQGVDRFPFEPPVQDARPNLQFEQFVSSSGRHVIVLHRDSERLASDAPRPRWYLEVAASGPLGQWTPVPVPATRESQRDMAYLPVFDSQDRITWIVERHETRQDEPNAPETRLSSVLVAFPEAPVETLLPLAERQIVDIDAVLDAEDRLHFVYSEFNHPRDNDVVRHVTW